MCDNEQAYHISRKEHLVTPHSHNSALAIPTSHTQPSNGRWLILLALLAVYTVWGSTYLAILIGVESFPPFLMTSIRFALPGCLLLLFLRYRGAPLPTARQWRNGAIVGCLLLGCGTGAVAFAEQWVASGLAAVAVAAVPLWAALFAGLWGQWPNRLEWLGLVLGFSGILLLNFEKGLSASPLGAIALIIGPVCWSFGSVWSRRVDMPVGMMSVAVQMLSASGFLLVISFLMGERLPSQATLPSVLSILYLGIFGSLVGFTAYMFLLRQVRPALATSYAYVNPLVAMFLGVIFANETVTPLGFIAMSIVLSGVGLVVMAKDTVMGQSKAT